ncbi:MAG: Arc family DNA-binding protein [Lachnospiraceae bacterium]|nr:Arc family DNA-binding protein [Lachnospiraceae bacterium]
MEKDKHLGLRIDSDTHTKLKELAEYDGRSINGEVIFLIRQAIRDYEEKTGTKKTRRNH